MLVLNSKFGLGSFAFLRDHLILWSKHLKPMEEIKIKFISFELKNEEIKETEFEIKTCMHLGGKRQYSSTQEIIFPLKVFYLCSLI